MIEDQLSKAGLSKSEIRVYTYVLENGISTPPQIAKGTGIARTNTYHILRSLAEQELVETRDKGKRQAYVATDPSSIVRNIEERKVAMETILPDLRALYKSQKNKPSIKFYDGWSAVKEIYTQVLETEELLALGSLEHLQSADEKFFDWFIREVHNKRIIGRDILTPGSRVLLDKMQKELGGLYTARFIHEKNKNFPTDILIWGDNVALVSLEQPIFGTVLTNKPLAQTFRVMFEMTWQSALPA